MKNRLKFCSYTQSSIQIYARIYGKTIFLQCSRQCWIKYVFIVVFDVKNSYFTRRRNVNYIKTSGSNSSQNVQMLDWFQIF